MRKNDLLVLQFGSRFLEAAYFRMEKEAYQLGFAEAIRVADKTDVELQSILQSVKGWLAPGKTDVILLVPRAQAIVKHFSLPSQEEKEVRKMVELSASRELPYNPQDLAYDFLMKKGRPVGYSEILFVGVLRESLVRWMKILEAEGLLPQEVDWATRGIVNRALQLGRMEKGRVHGIVHIGLESSEIFTVEEGFISFTRPLEGAPQKEIAPLSDDEIERLVEEIHLNLMAFRREKSILPDAVHLSGYLEKDPRLRQALENKISIPVSFLETFRNPFSLMPHWGVTEESRGGRVDLLPPEVREERRGLLAAVERGRLFVASTLLLSLILGVTILNAQKDAFLARRLELKLEKMSPDAKRLQEIVRNLDDVAEFQKEKTVILDFLAFLHQKAPEGIELSALRWEPEAVTLQGFAGTNEQLTELLAQLKEFPALSRVQLSFSQRSAREGKEQFEFEIVGERS